MLFEKDPRPNGRGSFVFCLGSGCCVHRFAHFLRVFRFNVEDYCSFCHFLDVFVRKNTAIPFDSEEFFGCVDAEHGVCCGFNCEVSHAAKAAAGWRSDFFDVEEAAFETKLLETQNFFRPNEGIFS